MRNEEIFFMDLVPSGQQDAHGDPALERRMSDAVYAEVRSIGQTEFYQAETVGLRPEIKFVITDYMDYQGQQYLVHSGTRYTVLKTYRKNSNELEITCYGGVRDAGAAVSDED